VPDPPPLGIIIIKIVMIVSHVLLHLILSPSFSSCCYRTRRSDPSDDMAGLLSSRAFRKYSAICGKLHPLFGFHLSKSSKGERLNRAVYLRNSSINFRKDLAESRNFSL
jgi:hypothetical protein